MSNLYLNQRASAGRLNGPSQLRWPARGMLSEMGPACQRLCITRRGIGESGALD